MSSYMQRNRSFATVILILLLQFLLNACSSTPDKAEHCGLVSAYLAPPETNNLYPTVITHLDGKSVISQPNYQLPTGKHIFTAVELINTPNLHIPISKRIPKQLTIDVQPNTQYHIAARYVPDHGKNQDYWQPYVWKKLKYECEFDHSTKNYQ